MCDSKNFEVDGHICRSEKSGRKADICERKEFKKLENLNIGI